MSKSENGTLWGRAAAWLVVILVPSLPLFGSTDDDEDFPPGVFARYASGDAAVERIDAAISFAWGGDAPDPRLPRAPFQSTWTSQLLVRQPGDYVFHAWLEGEVQVEVGGQPVLAGRRDEAGWVSGETFPLRFGEQPLRVAYRRTGDQAQVRLFWSSDQFPLEPVPAHLLFRDPAAESGEEAPRFALIDRGRRVFESHRCNRCHRRENDPLAPAGPDLTHVAAAADAESLASRIRAPHAALPGARMPAFGHTPAEARAMAAFLNEASRGVDLESAPASEQPGRDQRRGETLFRSLGCLACHRIDGLGEDGPYGGGDLSAVGARRSPAWLHTWLRRPETLNRDHRMPVFSLTGDERRQLTLYLSSLTAADSTPLRTEEAVPPAEDPALGRKLIEAARCAACHRIPGLEADLSGLPDLSAPPDDWSESCLDGAPDREAARPAYAEIDGEAVVAYLESRPGPLSPESRFAHGARLLEVRNCLACHQRDLAPGIAAVAGRAAQADPLLRGQSGALIPPPLTAVGDKLLDDALAVALAGRQEQQRLPWLRVRMPRFAHTPEEASALLEFLIAHDRIPAGAPGAEGGLRNLQSPAARSASEPRAADPADRSPAADPGDADQPGADPQVLAAGHALVGIRGFSCIACHKVGAYEPRQVALATRGSDLLRPADRMRREFFLRWTRSPMRIVPGMEMPSYERPVSGVLDGTVDAQLSAVWEALNDPQFVPPTNPAVVEQFFTVPRGAPARMVRDVFTNPPENGGGYVARALAVGLENGHNVLYDLDGLSVRSWAFGDFARQRTQGKSWSWEMAGVPVAFFGTAASDYFLKAPGGDSGGERDGWIAPHREFGTAGRLIDYRPHGAGLRLRYRLNFHAGRKAHPVRITETVTPLPADETGGGWRREIEAAAVPGGYHPHVAVRLPDDPRRAAVTAPEAAFDEASLEALGTGDRRALLPMTRGAGGAFTAALEYRSPLPQVEGDIPLPPPIPVESDEVTTVPGFAGVRLPLDRSIMPTAVTWTTDGTLAFTSLKGHVYVAHDTDGDGLEDTLTVFEEGLAAPFGLIADGDSLIVAHKPEVLRLRDVTRDGRADHREVLATGWGYSDDYHDWTCGLVRDASGNLYVGLGSDYAQPRRPRETTRWRGKVLRIAPAGDVAPVGHAFRYPTGLAINDEGEIFVSDNQGDRNPFNEINHLVEGRHYGVPSLAEEDPDAPETPPAIKVPHPWTRSVNGLFFLPGPERGGRETGLRETAHREAEDRQAPRPAHPFAGHGIGCEYDSRFLIRFTVERVGDTIQGAAYAFSRPDGGTGEDNFLGPLCGAVAPNGDLYIGGIHDSGWLGGPNTGEIVRLRPSGEIPLGIRELRATPDGFEIDFTGRIDPSAAARADNYSLSGYTRVWQGGYATPDTGRHRVRVTAVDVSPEADKVTLRVDRLQEGYVYEVTCGRIGPEAAVELWPATGHYTMNRIPR